MAGILFKWLLVGGILLTPSSGTHHPIYVSVTEIEHNAKDKTLEISCKIFTDDFEKTLAQLLCIARASKAKMSLVDTSDFLSYWANIE